MGAPNAASDGEGHFTPKACDTEGAEAGHMVTLALEEVAERGSI